MSGKHQTDLILKFLALFFFDWTLFIQRKTNYFSIKKNKKILTDWAQSCVQLCAQSVTLLNFIGT
jgi:hypothetical protein